LAARYTPERAAPPRACGGAVRAAQRADAAARPRYAASARFAMLPPSLLRCHDMLFAFAAAARFAPVCCCAYKEAYAAARMLFERYARGQSAAQQALQRNE